MCLPLSLRYLILFPGLGGEEEAIWSRFYPLAAAEIALHPPDPIFCLLLLIALLFSLFFPLISQVEADGRPP